MDKAENGESDNWDVDYHMSRNVIPSCLFLLSQVIEPEKYHQPLFNIFDDFYKWKVFTVIYFFPQIKMKTTFLLISLLLNLQKQLVKESSFAFVLSD